MHTRISTEQGIWITHINNKMFSYYYIHSLFCATDVNTVSYLNNKTKIKNHKILFIYI